MHVTPIAVQLLQRRFCFSHFTAIIANDPVILISNYVYIVRLVLTLSNHYKED